MKTDSEIKNKILKICSLKAVADAIVEHKNLDIKTNVPIEELNNWKAELEKLDLCQVSISEIANNKKYKYSVTFSDNKDYWS